LLRQGLIVNGLKIHSLELLILLLFVCYRVYYVEGNVLGCLKIKTPEVTIALASMKKIDSLESLRGKIVTSFGGANL